MLLESLDILLMLMLMPCMLADGSDAAGGGLM
jgi:hypothetical protein